MTDEAWQALERYQWRGNVRELQNVMEQITAVADPETPIELAQLPPAVTAATQALRPSRERRRQLADELYQAVVDGGYSFWEHIHPMFLGRDITRHDIREMVRRGLSVTRGNYRGLLDLFNIPRTDYKKFMNFLATHDCGADFREFRNPTHAFDRRPRELFPELPRPGGPTSPDQEAPASDHAKVAS